MLTPTPARILDSLGTAKLCGGICVQTNVGEPQTRKYRMTQGSLAGKPVWGGRQLSSLIESVLTDSVRSSTSAPVLRDWDGRGPSQEISFPTLWPLVTKSSGKGFGFSLVNSFKLLTVSRAERVRLKTMLTKISTLTMIMILMILIQQMTMMTTMTTPITPTIQTTT